MVRVLFVASESAPFIKSGGLGEVIYSLSKEIKKIDIDAGVILPKYSEIPFNFQKEMKKLYAFNVNVGWRNQYCGIEYLELDGVPFYFVDNEYYFKRCGMYGHYDEAERFAFFCRAVIESLEYIDFLPDIIHCHDWQTGMVAPMLRIDYPKYNSIKTIYTIHNLYYQGVFPKEILEDLLGLDESTFNISGLEFYGGVNFMKGGLNYSDIITTVSRNYSEEIKTPLYGERLDDILRSKSNILFGIENGIDYSIHNPSTDPYIYQKYDVNTIDLKVKNKLALQKELGLTVDSNIPMIGMVTRLVKQKGIDILLSRLEKIIKKDLQIVILGTGDKHYEDMLYEMKAQYPEKVSVNIMFADRLAHKIYAASDIFLMPSLFEPCGLGQMIASKYGAIPIVRETGGLKDTVIPYNEYTKEGTGFSFKNYNPGELNNTIDYAIKFYNDKEVWRRIMQNAMNLDNSWKKSSGKYKELYLKVMEEK
ncbi:MAG: glycogen synthase GlgA [Firmicutes bacterium]|nr:glycogen synthase GlgA [Bacillota bacterium]